jgi:imidazolonepropionase
MEEHKRFLVRIRNAAQVVRVGTGGLPFKTRAQMNEVEVIHNAGLIINHEGFIEVVDTEERIGQDPKYATASFDLDFDASGKVILPGLVDGHTHPVWQGDRVHEFAMKLAGATYMDIHKAGGGIGFTVAHTREASENVLVDSCLARLDRMLQKGTTLVECKSGYGLDEESEMKLLRVLHQVKQKSAVEIVSTYLGAHSVPKGSTAEAATEDIVHRQIPKLRELREKGEISPEMIDVFLEEGVFDQEQTKRILQAGKEIGLELNFHGDEIHCMHSGELAGEMEALAVSHLEKVSEAGIEGLARRPTVAVLLPTTAYVLRLTPPPARQLIDAGVPVALGSDFNPNAHCSSMPLVMNMACILFRMTMPEALVAATLNAAASMNRSKTHGSLEVGKVGDLIVLDAPRWEHLIYQFPDPPITHVFKKGKCVYQTTTHHHS